MLPGSFPAPVRPPRLTMVLAALTGLAVAAATWLAIPAPRLSLGSSGWTQTTSGPVGPADRTMLVTLRQTALWEAVVGQQSQQMAVDPAVRQLGAAMATDLDWLTGQVRPLADQLSVVLPSQPTPDQQAWLSAIANTSGSDYDRAMVSRLRQGCAQTLDVVSTARADTRNEQVRALADRAAQLIGRHLQALDRLRLAG